MEDFLNNMSNPEQQKGLYATLFGLCMMAAYLWWLLRYFVVLSERLKMGIESYFSVTIEDSNDDAWSIIDREGKRVAWYKSLGLQTLRIPFLLAIVFLPFAVLMAIWFAVVKFFWK